jgi:hypothetical protein
MEIKLVLPNKYSRLSNRRHKQLILFCATSVLKKQLIIVSSALGESKGKGACRTTYVAD